MRRPTDIYAGSRPAAWDAIRRYILDEEPTCRLCGAPSAEVDHIWPRCYGGDDRRDNLQGLCLPCNRTKADTVSLAAATEDQLAAAIVAVLYRVQTSLDDAQRFVEVLACRPRPADPELRWALLLRLDAHVCNVIASADLAKAWIRDSIRATNGSAVTS
jgi:hypothetical protein